LVFDASRKKDLVLHECHLLAGVVPIIAMTLACHTADVEAVGFAGHLPSMVEGVNAYEIKNSPIRPERVPLAIWMISPC
jgi:hypothetical protein